MSKSILIIEDDRDLLNYLREILTSQRYSVHTAGNGVKARKKFFEVNPDVVLLDLHLPDIDGASLLLEFKQEKGKSQILILTADSDPVNVARLLKSGADDYISKPFTTDELLARIQARLRDQKDEVCTYFAGDVTMNTETMDVKKGDKVVELTQTEFELLKYLLENKNKVLTREMILSRVWSSDSDIETRVVDVYIGYLRKKLDTDPKNKLIHSKRGYGYSIKEQD